MVRVVLLLAASAAAAAAVAAALLPAAQERSCSSYTTCGSCIVSPNCRWCSKIKGKPECMEEGDERRCEGETYMPKNQYEEIQNDTNSQLRPQRSRLKLRVGEKFELKVVFAKVEDYPVDLYYLMDLSASMNDDKENLSKLGANLTIAMQKVTSNFRLGFGSFVDKVAMPFVNTAPKLLENPCTNIPCARPYSFKNHMSLTKDTALFSSSVDAAQISGNIDAPEGGFDALMQAIVCTERIKWRPDARHLLVMATDDTFHFAGDGKLAGVVEPNDEQCHMNEKGDYTHDLEFDYPSISQLNRKAREKNINIIFAVTENVVNIYESLDIESSSARILSVNSDNVINLVLDQYHKLVETVELSDDAAEKGVNIHYKTKCQDDSGPERETKICKNVNAKTKPIVFHTTIHVPICPTKVSKDVWEEIITISPKGINESMQLHLEVYCGCPCEHEGNMGYEGDSSLCNHNGTEKCGVCECFPGRSGQNCECDDSSENEKKGIENCISDSDNTTVCSDRGECHCGVCKCNIHQDPKKRVYGRFCECDNYSCPRNSKNDIICSGEENGECECGKCVCKAGWAGETCENKVCDPDSKCYRPGDDKLCSGFGECDCGMCLCTDHRTGPYCEECLTCPVDYCKELENCVEYQVHQIESSNDTSCEKLNVSLPVKQVESMDESTDESTNRIYCTSFDDDGCSFDFAYEKQENTFTVIAEKEKECPAAVDLLGIIFGVIGGTVFLGMLIIGIWKIITTIYDQREYAKFEQERAQSKWERGDNPLYVQATTTFSNPTFSGQ